MNGLHQIFASVNSTKFISKPARLLTRVSLFSLLFLAFAGIVQAQWESTTYTLKGGWNAIYLHGDATYATPDVLFASGAGSNIEEIWRWNPNSEQMGFTSSPLIPSAGTPEWSVWYRNPIAPAVSTLTEMMGQTAYLVKCAGTSSNTYAVTLKVQLLPPSSLWVRNGANLLGFPSLRSGASYPSFSNYFATFPAAFAANAQVFKYDGGVLGPANPVQVFSPVSEPLDRNKAYWFEAEVTGDFYAPIEVTPSNPDGLSFGRTGSEVILRLRNRTAATVTVTMAPVNSASAPSGETAIAGSVPLTRRTFESSSQTSIESPVSSAFSEVIGPQSSIELSFGIDRASMTGNSASYYASLLRITDSSGLIDVSLPANASVGTLAGLWVGDATVSNVESKVATSTGTTTPRSFLLRTLLHLDDNGRSRLLSQAFLGSLSTDPTGQGICLTENRLDADSKDSAMRIVAAHMPLDRSIDETSPGTNSGTIALGNTLVRTVTIPWNDPTNPFVHQYHPDHDNLDARPDGTSIPLGAGVESYTIVRECSFEFTTTPPVGVSALGWGSTVVGGNYTEVLTGPHKETITVEGTFVLRRISEIGAIAVN
jgi:hypothetical protein